MNRSITAALALTTIAGAAIAQPVFVAKGAGDIGAVGLEKIITKPVLLLTLAALNGNDVITPIAMNRPMDGKAGAAAIASNPFSTNSDYDPAEGTGDGFLTGPIYRPGPPATYDSVTTRNVQANVALNSSSAQASIQGTKVLDNRGGLLSVNAATTTTASANAWIGTASSSAIAKTDPVKVGGGAGFLPGPRHFRMTMDFMANRDESIGDAPIDPNATFGMAAINPFTNDPTITGSATTTFSMNVRTNIPGMESLFSMGITANDADGLSMSWGSGAGIEQPFSATAFTQSQAVAGIWWLDDAHRKFAIDFTLPDGFMSTDSEGSYLFNYSAEYMMTTSATAAPTPGAVALGVLSTGLIARRRRLKS